MIDKYASYLSAGRWFHPGSTFSKSFKFLLLKMYVLLVLHSNSNWQLAQVVPSTMNIQGLVRPANLLNLRGIDLYYHMWVLDI